MEPLFAIINGAAGGGRARPRADLALGALRDAGVDVVARFTEGPGHATELAAEAAADGARRFLAAGGDGTSYEVLNGLMPLAEREGARFTLALLPLGTGNSFLRDFGITDEHGAIAAILRGRSHTVDVVRAEHEAGVLYYMNLLSLGFSAEAGDLTNRRFKALGAAGYVFAVVASVARLGHPVIPIRIDGDTTADRRPCTLLSFSNSRYTGGTMMMAPRADVTDGKLDLIRVGALSRVGLLRAFPRIFRGTHVDMPEVEQSRASRIDFEDRVPRAAMIDGEVETFAFRSLETLPGAIEVIA